MGQYNSSRTRVAPVFDWLLTSDPTGRSWVPILLQLVAPVSKTLILPQSDFVEACWLPSEKSLAPPRALLRWLIENLQEPVGGKWGGETARIKREMLVARDAATVKQALEMLQFRTANKGWHILEGPSFPDVFLATSDMVVVVEGKRTERKPTISTTWMQMRHQMLRHLDGALEILGDRQLYGFFIVEGLGNKLPADWVQYAQDTVSTEAIAGSLPHRDEAEKRVIKDAFLGVTTWQALCERLSIPRQLITPLENPKWPGSTAIKI